MNPIQEFFDSRARDWDSSCPHDHRKIETLLSLVPPPEGGKVLDAACGTGVLLPHLLARKPKELWGVDLSPNMIERAAEKYTDPRLTLRACDLFDFSEGEFDEIILYSAYPHFQDRPRLVRHLARLLKPGGRLLIAHSEGREVINGRHSGAASAISWPLQNVWTEREALLPCFTVDLCVDTPSYFLLSGVTGSSHL